MKTFSQKPADVTRTWYVVDAAAVPLGRLSTQVASLLLGKAKPTITPHVDGGDFVIVINAAQLKVSGDKLTAKTYYRHSGYPGGLTEISLEVQMIKDPTVVIIKAVRGMLPVNKLRPGRLNRLKVYADDQHPHAPQQPIEFILKQHKQTTKRERGTK